jgi:hypothetical protein
MKTGQDAHRHYSNRSVPPVSLAGAVKQHPQFRQTSQNNRLAPRSNHLERLQTMIGLVTKTSAPRPTAPGKPQHGK